MVLCRRSRKTLTHMEDTNLVIAAASAVNSSGREFVPLPPIGGDPVCGLSRSFWYSLEAKGLISLVRIRKPGQVRGRVLLPIPQAVALLQKLNSGKAVIAAGPGRSAKKAEGSAA